VTIQKDERESDRNYQITEGISQRLKEEIQSNIMNQGLILSVKIFH